MKLLYNLKHFSDFEQGIIATIGNFDGVHLGHQHLIKSLRKKANNLQLPLVLILFEPQPKEYFQKNSASARLSSLREKINALNELDIDYVYCIKFNHKLAQTEAKDFAHFLFDALKINYLLVGQDFRFGKNRTGDIALLQKLSVVHQAEVAVYPEFAYGNERVSSTRVRAALQQGDLQEAAKLLGRTYTMCGRVIHGDGRGRQWGIPTANIGLNRTTLPLNGVFVVQMLIQGKVVVGVANIGKRPTIDGVKNSLEVHLFDFNQMIYGELVQVFFLHKLRDEVKFTSVDALIKQIHQDMTEARAYLSLNTAKM